MTDPLLLLVDALAVFRLTRLIAADTILEPLREWVWLRWPGYESFYDSVVEDGMVRGRPVVLVEGSSPREWVADPTWLGKWLGCGWCVSMWVAPVVVACRVWWGWWQWPALMLAMSAVAGLLHTWSDK